MKLAVGVLTHNVIANGRLSLLESTISSIAVAFPGFAGTRPLVLDNGSTDGTAEAVRELGGVLYEPVDGNTTPGRGMNQLVAELLKTGGDVLVRSDDDMLWRPGAEEKLLRFWTDAPEDVVVLSGLLEPVWHWNTPRGVIEVGGVRALWRDSAPGAAMSFRASDWSKFGPVKDDFGEDHDACVRIRALGGRVAQIDLAEHAGWGYSTHQNKANQAALPLDRARWGV